MIPKIIFKEKEKREGAMRRDNKKYSS